MYCNQYISSFSKDNAYRKVIPRLIVFSRFSERGFLNLFQEYKISMELCSVENAVLKEKKTKFIIPVKMKG